MSHDLTAPVAGAPDLAPSLGFDESRTRLRDAIRAFAAHQGPLAPHLAYGRCTKDEYATLHLLRLDTGRESTLALAPPAHAQLEGARLYVSSARLLRNRPMLSSP